jgi:hypothetical protein
VSQSTADVKSGKIIIIIIIIIIKTTVFAENTRRLGIVGRSVYNLETLSLVQKYFVNPLQKYNTNIIAVRNLVVGMPILRHRMGPEHYVGTTAKCEGSGRQNYLEVDNYAIQQRNPRTQRNS